MKSQIFQTASCPHAGKSHQSLQMKVRPLSLKFPLDPTLPPTTWQQGRAKLMIRQHRVLIDHMESVEIQNRHHFHTVIKIKQKISTLIKSNQTSI